MQEMASITPSSPHAHTCPHMHTHALTDGKLKSQVRKLFFKICHKLLTNLVLLLCTHVVEEPSATLPQMVKILPPSHPHQFPPSHLLTLTHSLPPAISPSPIPSLLPSHPKTFPPSCLLTLSYSKNSNLSSRVQFLPMGQTLMRPLRNSMNVPLRYVEGREGRGEEGEEGKLPEEIAGKGERRKIVVQVS